MRVHSAVLSLFPFDYSESTSFPPPKTSLSLTRTPLLCTFPRHECHSLQGACATPARATTCVALTQQTLGKW